MSPKNNPEFAALIRRAFHASGLTQAELARRGGPSDTTLRNLIEGKEVGVPTSTLKKLDTAFEWPPGTAAKALMGIPSAVTSVRNAIVHAPTATSMSNAPTVGLAPIFRAVSTAVDAANRSLDDGDENEAVGQLANAVLLVAFILGQVDNDSPLAAALSAAVLETVGVRFGPGDSSVTDAAKVSAARSVGLFASQLQRVKTPDELTAEDLAALTNDQLRTLVADDEMWADYVRTKRPELAEEWEF